MTYSTPLKEMAFVLNRLVGLEAIAGLPGKGDVTTDLADAVLTECARLGEDVIAPLNSSADRNPGGWQAGTVSAAAGFKQAYRQYVNGGWQGISHPAEYGGQGLPKVIGAPCMEILQSANLAFSLCPLLTDGAIEALLTAASAEVKERYLAKLIAGEWTGTMNLTEAQAGSDLALLRSSAVPQADGSYLISGTKIFITWGEHDMADNIVHLVLARTPTAPEGVKGISLFVVPKFLVADDGSLGSRNQVECVSIEHKLGIRASATAVLQYDGATGHLVGEENRGLEYMFVMMNAARFAVGMQGIAVSEAAYQKAAAYARERVQGRPVDGSSQRAVPIIQHPDVRRMLMTMRALTEGGRALAYVAAGHCDIATHSGDPERQAAHRALYEFLVPIVKGWSTEASIEVASLGVQVHGGMGYIEETGASQFLRDARILPIYEGTTAIQANDLIGRKTLRDGGATAMRFVEMVDETLVELEQSHLDGMSAVRSMRHNLRLGRDTLVDSIDFLLANAQGHPNAVYGAGVPYLKLCGLVLCGWQMARAMLASIAHKDSDPEFHAAKIATSHFFASHLLPQSVGYATAIQAPEAIEAAMALDASQL